MKRTMIGLVLLMHTAVFAQDDSSGVLLRKIDAFRAPYDHLLVRTRLTSYEGTEEKEVALFDAYIEGVGKSLVVQREGKNRDMKILYVEEKMWVQLPGSRRPIRITPVQRLMGQASNGDVAMVRYEDDYTAVPAGEMTVGGSECRKLRLLARKPSATYRRIDLVVRKSDFRPVKADFFLASGKHFKTASFEEYTCINGHPVLTRMTIFDVLQDDRKTVFEYETIQEKRLDAKYFNKNYLVYVRGL